MQKTYTMTNGRDSRLAVMPFAGPTSEAVHLK
jgi:hypothetical protein